MYQEHGKRCRAKQKKESFVGNSHFTSHSLPSIFLPYQPYIHISIIIMYLILLLGVKLRVNPITVACCNLI
jgi:hypothetical protein